jgi:hypothetical protein
MDYASVETQGEPRRSHDRGPATPLELRVWIALPLRRSEFPIRRKPSLAVSLRRCELQRASGPSTNVRKERAPSLSLEAGILGVLAAFLVATSIGLLGSALEAMLMWLL